MKCIRRIIKGVESVKRVSDEEAVLLIANNGYHYCPKHVWKKAGRP